MVAVGVEIRRYVNDSYPGWVECWLIDAAGSEWSFVEKVPIVTVEELDARSRYPRKGIVACRVVGHRTDRDGRGVVVIDTTEPWGVEATSGETRFAIRPEQVIDLDSNENP